MFICAVTPLTQYGVGRKITEYVTRNPWLVFRIAYSVNHLLSVERVPYFLISVQILS
jgi:hypothetical protein